MNRWMTYLSGITLVGAILLGMQWLYVPVTIPSVHVQAMTQETLMDGLRAEREQKELDRAIASSARLYAVYSCPADLARPTAETAIHEGLNARLVAAVVVVESTCNDHAVSKANATGLMQVMPVMHHATKRELLDRDTNLHVGSHLLATLIREHGLNDGIANYFGVTPGSDASEQYTNHVLTVAGYRRRIYDSENVSR